MKHFFFLLISTCATGAYAQQSWPWLNSPNAEINVVHHSVDLDPNNNTFTVGRMYKSANFGTITVQSPEDYLTLFLAKQNSSGAYQFVKQIKANSGITSAVVKTDDAGNVYIFGTATGSTLYLTSTDSIVFQNSTPTSSTAKMFLAKYDNNGNFQWAKKGEGPSLDVSARAIMMKGNELYLGGDYLGSGTFSGLSIPARSSNVSFVVKVNTNNGNGIWLNAAQVNASTFLSGLTHDGTNLYACGKFQNTIIFNNVTITNPNFTNNGGERIYVVKFDADGSAIWGKEEGGIANYTTTALDANSANTIACDGNGNLFVAGSYQDATGSISNRLQTPFISKYNTNTGVKEWTKLYNSQIENTINDLAIDNNNNPIVIGEYIGSLSLGSIALTPDNTERKGFIARINNGDGSTISAQTMGQHGQKTNAQNLALSRDKSHGVVAGSYKTALTIGSLNTASGGNNTAFTTRFNLANSSSLITVEPTHLKLYPNPATSQLNYQLTKSGKADFSIVNSIGQILISGTHYGDAGNINISQLPQGNYFLTISQNDNRSSQPFQKQ